MKLTIMIIGFLLLIGALAFSFSRRQYETPSTMSGSPGPAGVIRYMALGDSYTIGQSVATEDRWPNQLVKRLTQNGTKIELVSNPSVTGYTTKNLIERELPVFDKTKPDFVTILIGVNDYVQGLDAQTFNDNLNTILNHVQKRLAKPKQVVLVTIPDYGKTPTGSRYGAPAESEIGIRAFNKLITQAGTSRGLLVADIFTISQGVTADPSLTADDGLHPSAKQYSQWTAVIYKTIQAGQLFKL